MSGKYQVPSAVQPVVDAKGIITNPWWQWATSIGKNAGDPIEWSSIVNTPTTLGGYGITDAYTQTQINSMFSALAGIYQPLSSNLTAYAGGDLPSAFTLGIVDSADAGAWRTAIGAGTSNFDGAFSSLTGLPTTLGGYGITDAYTDSQVDTLLSGYQPLNTILTTLAGLSDASGVLTNDGVGGLSWAPAGGVGTVTSVALAVPTGFSVSGSPVTSSGTLTLAYDTGYQGYTSAEATKLSGIATGATVGATWGTNLSSIPTIISTLAALSNASGVLTNDGSGVLSWGAGSSVSPANPSASIGLTAVNGSASTYMRSDAAPALSQSIAPTWTGLHTWSQAANIELNFVESSAGTNVKNTYMGVYGGVFQLGFYNDAKSASSGFLTVTRSGYAVSSLVYGNVTDLPTHRFYGNVGIGAAATVSAALIVSGNGGTFYAGYSGSNLYSDHDTQNFRSPSNGFRNLLNMTVGAIILGNQTDLPNLYLHGSAHFESGLWHKDVAGANRFYFANTGRTYFSAPPTGTSECYEWRNGSDTAIAFLRGDGFFRAKGFGNLAGDTYFLPVDGILSYGSYYLYGATGGWTGLALNEGTNYPTFMAHSISGYGVYLQGGSYAGWGMYDDFSYFMIQRKLIQYSSELPYMRIESGGHKDGGRVYISTSAPSGTPADGDIWIQRAA